MILAIDIGNTNITLGGYEDEKLLFTGRLATSSSLTAQQYALELTGLLQLKGFSKSDVTDAVICSVVPMAGVTISEAIYDLIGVEPVVLGPGVKTGLNIKIDNPAQLGADLVAGAVGALDKYPMPCIIIDMGTATTISALDENGTFIGCVIAAGIKSTLEALVQKTAQLPSVKIEAPKYIIGKNTIDSMKSGLVFGAAAMLDGMVDRMTDEIGMKATVVATGGLAPKIVKHCKNEIITDDDLLLDGLYKIYKKVR